MASILTYDVHKESRCISMQHLVLFSSAHRPLTEQGPFPSGMNTFSAASEPSQSFSTFQEPKRALHASLVPSVEV